MLDTLRDLFSPTRLDSGSNPAVIEGQSRITFGELAEQVEGCSADLQSLGIRKGGRLAIHLPHSIYAAVELFATLFVGGVAVFVNDILKSRQVKYILERAEASILITSTRLLGSLESVALPKVKILTTDAGIPHEEMWYLLL
jgi:acyl-CoA synthetase (AMP-forming)/AMP-acid ligase II